MPVESGDGLDSSHPASRSGVWMASGGWSAAASLKLQSSSDTISIQFLQLRETEMTERWWLVTRKKYKWQIMTFSPWASLGSPGAWVPFIVWRVPNNVSLSVSLTDWLMIWLTFHIEVFRHNCCLLQTLPLFGENVPILQIGYLLVTLKVPTFTCLLEMWKGSPHNTQHCSSAFRSTKPFNCPVLIIVTRWKSLLWDVWCGQCYAWRTLK